MKKLLDQIRASDTVGFVAYVWRQIGTSQVLGSASMLTFTTLLSLVPLLIVGFAIVSALPGMQTLELELKIERFLFDYFVPAQQDVIRAQIEDIVSRAQSLKATMSIFLVLTSLLLMGEIEGTLNRIWGVHSPRPLSNRFLVYWAALTLGPILFGASIAISSYFFSQALSTQFSTVSSLAQLGQVFAPFVVSLAAFFLLFWLVPNRNVPWKHALVGAVVTAFFFELVKEGFGLYLTLGTYDRIYGGIAAFPIVLVWIYLCWAVILGGAVFTVALAGYRRAAAKSAWPSRLRFVLAYRLVGHLFRAQQQGHGLTTEQLLSTEPAADDHELQGLLEKLRERGMLRRDEEGAWILIRDLQDFTLGELYESGRYVMPRARHWDQLPDSDDPWNRSLELALASSHEQLEQSLATPLRSLYTRASNEPQLRTVVSEKL